MMRPLVVPLPGNDGFAERLAVHIGAELGSLETRSFPDGETYLRFRVDPAGRRLVLVCTLDRPDPKVLPLLFAAAAGRDLGATRIGLVAPYLSYMRQDARFLSGEAVTSVAFAKLLSLSFDWLVTVDPHLHRHKTLGGLYTIPARAVPAVPLIAAWIAANEPAPLLLGPDIESEQWVAEVARLVNAPFRVLRKQRRGDRDVSIEVTDLSEFRDRTPVLLDDIVSSGRTMIETARQTKEQHMPLPVCIAVHALLSDGAYTSLRALARRVVSTNTVLHETNAIDVAAAIADQVASLSRDVGSTER